uniref:Reverse transcriptase n=1 Tax=Solanum tuberosum TaxID=4113 RepID=M1A0N0_SOLTU
MSTNHLSLIHFRPTSTSPNTHHSYLLTGALRVSSTHAQTISALPPHLVHHGGHTHLVPNIFVPNPISPSMPTHTSREQAVDVIRIL